MFFLNFEILVHTILYLSYQTLRSNQFDSTFSIELRIQKIRSFHFCNEMKTNLAFISRTLTENGKFNLRKFTWSHKDSHSPWLWANSIWSIDTKFESFRFAYRQSGKPWTHKKNYPLRMRILSSVKLIEELLQTSLIKMLNFEWWITND